MSVAGILAGSVLRGVSEQQLVSTIVAAKRADLDQAVRDGTITQAQADQIYQHLSFMTSSQFCAMIKP